MSKRLISWFRVTLLIAIIVGTPFGCGAAFYAARDVVLSYPNDLHNPNLWATIALLCVLFAPVILIEVFALSFAKSASQRATGYKVLEATCWIAAMGAFVVPAVFSVTQDVGHIMILVIQVTASAGLAAAALLARICQQSDGVAFYPAEQGLHTPGPPTSAAAIA